MRWFVPCVVAVLAMLTPAAAQDKKPVPVSFTKQIAPIFVKKCLACHGERQPKSGYQLHTFEKMLQEGDFGEPPVTPGKPDESLLYQLVASRKKDVWMPKEADHLPDAEVALIRRWVAEGAKFDSKDQKAKIASLVPASYDPPPESYPRPVPMTALAFHPGGGELAAGGYNEITVWNPADGKLLRRINNVAQRTYALAYSPDGKLLAAASGTPGSLGEVKLIDPVSGKTLKRLASMADVAFGVAFSPKGEKLAACAADRSIRIYDVATSKQEVLIEDHADWVLAVAWNHDGTRLASASRDKTSKVFDAKSGESQATYNGHGQPVFGVGFSPDGKQVFTAGADRKIHVWNPADGKKAAEIAGFGNEVYRIEIAAGHIFSCSADKTARKHVLGNRKQVHSYGGHADWVYTLAVHPDTKRLATGTFTGEVHVWNTDDGKQLQKFFAAPGFKP